MQSYLQKPCQENFGKFQEFGESRFGGSEKDRYFLKILKWWRKLVRDYKRGKLVSYFLNNAAKTCLYGLNISENIEIEHIFQSKAFVHLSGNLHTSCFSAFSDISHKLIWGNKFFSKLRNYINKGTLRTVWFEIFHSYINDVPIAWGNTYYPQQRVPLLQRNVLRITNFAQFNYLTSLLFYNNNILKFVDSVQVKVVLINKCFNKVYFCNFFSKLLFMMK